MLWARLTQLCMGVAAELASMLCNGPPAGVCWGAPIMPSLALRNPASRQATHAVHKSLLREGVQIQ